MNITNKKTLLLKFGEKWLMFPKNLGFFLEPFKATFCLPIKKIPKSYNKLLTMHA